MAAACVVTGNGLYHITVETVDGIEALIQASWLCAMVGRAGATRSFMQSIRFKSKLRLPIPE
jgi:hypothetical protein